MTETLREKEELSRVDSENLRKAREEVASLRRKVDQHNELMGEKDRTAQVRSSCAQLYFVEIHCIGMLVQVLHDEINTLQLELGQIEDRNQTLTKDNAKLLQRWLDAKQAEVNKMNEANEFYEDMQSKREAVLNWRTKSSSNTEDEPDGRSATHESESGNGEEKRGSGQVKKKDGIPSPEEKGMNQTPNG